MKLATCHLQRIAVCSEALKTRVPLFPPFCVLMKAWEGWHVSSLAESLATLTAITSLSFVDPWAGLFGDISVGNPPHTPSQPTCGKERICGDGKGSIRVGARA